MRLATILLLTVGAALCQVKTEPKKEPAPRAQRAMVSTQKPNAIDFKSYEDYVEALAGWIVEQKVVTSGKDVVLSVAPEPSARRYQIVFGPQARADTFMIDTATGKVWHRVSYTDVVGDPEVWRLMPRIDSDQELTKWQVTQTLKP